MHERLEKYYEHDVGYRCGFDINHSSAIAAFGALLDGETHGGDIFRMHSDGFMKEYLYPEDFEYWMEEKRKVL